MNIHHYQKIVRWSAIYDLIVTAPFALPGLSGLSIAAFAAAHEALELPGYVPPFLGPHLLFVNLLGCIVVVWSLLRLLRTEAAYGFYDAIARFLFAAWQLYYLLSGQITPLLWFFFFPELVFGVVQAYGYYLVREREKLRLAKWVPVV